MILPGTVGYLVPLVIAPADSPRAAWSPAGLLLVAGGSLLLLRCVVDFHRAGHGTLAPWWAPRELVRSGAYRWSRNPMYVAVVLVLSGWAVWFASLALALYAAAVTVAFHLRVLYYEEPRLESAFGDAWRRWRATVPRWIAFRRR